MTYWTEAEVALLRDLATRGITHRRVLKYLPWRSWSSVREKARQLGIWPKLLSEELRASKDLDPNTALMRVNRLEDYSPESRYGLLQLEFGLAVMARHGRDGHVEWQGQRMRYIDAISALMESIHDEAQKARQARREVA